MDKNRLEEESRLLLDEQASPSKSGKRSGRWLLIVLLAGAIGYGGYHWWHTAKAAAADATTSQATSNGGRGRGGRGGRGADRPAVITIPARHVDMPVYLRGLGTVAASNTVTVRSRVDGQLLHIGFREGQFVKQGDLLAQIDKRPFEVQLAQARGQLARDQALLESAHQEQQRNQLLLDKGLIPRQQYDTQAASVGQYQGSIQSDEALIDNANLQITYSNVVAPISGQVGLRLVDEGNIVRAADPGGIVVITQLQPISVLFSIPEDNLGDVLRKLRSGQQLHVEAWDHDDTKKIADGILLTADNQIDATTGTSKLKAVFDNKNNALYPNQFVNVRLLVDVLKNAVVVPSAAIQRGSQGPFLYVIRDGQTAEMRPVTLKNTEGNDVALGSGVDAGDMVVLEGMDKIQNGSRVVVQTPGQTPGQTTQPSGEPSGRGRGKRNGQ